MTDSPEDIPEIIETLAERHAKDAVDMVIEAQARIAGKMCVASSVAIVAGDVKEDEIHAFAAQFSLSVPEATLLRGIQRLKIELTRQWFDACMDAVRSQQRRAA